MKTNTATNNTKLTVVFRNFATRAQKATICTASDHMWQTKMPLFFSTARGVRWNVLQEQVEDVKLHKPPSLHLHKPFSLHLHKLFSLRLHKLFSLHLHKLFSLHLHIPTHTAVCAKHHSETHQEAMCSDGTNGMEVLHTSAPNETEEQLQAPATLTHKENDHYSRRQKEFFTAGTPRTFNTFERRIGRKVTFH